METNTSELYATLTRVLYGGIDPSIPGHGGKECTAYLDRKLMVLDTTIGEQQASKTPYWRTWETKMSSFSFRSYCNNGSSRDVRGHDIHASAASSSQRRKSRLETDTARPALPRLWSRAGLQDLLHASTVPTQPMSRDHRGRGGCGSSKGVYVKC